MDDNPYASPLAEDDTESKVSGSDLASARRRVKPPAIAMCVVAGLGLLLDMVVLYWAIVETFFGMFEPMWFVIVANVGGNLLIIFLHAVIIAGGIKMYRLHNYSTAMTAAIITMLPFCSPLLFLGVPFGIWAAAVLLRRDVKQAFTTPT